MEDAPRGPAALELRGFQFQGGDDAEVGSTAAHGPEEVLVLVT